VARARTHLKISRLANRLKAQAKKMENLANTDPLTNIANRMRFNAILEHQLGVSKRYQKTLSIIFFDIDHFKQINDNFGHKAGDNVLVALCQLISKHIRTSDLFARWGGEEFLILVPELSLTQLISLSEKLRLQVDRFVFPDVKHITCSFGITQMKSDDDPKGLINRADEALYEAKESGRNKVVVH